MVNSLFLFSSLLYQRIAQISRKRFRPQEKEDKYGREKAPQVCPVVDTVIRFSKEDLNRRDDLDPNEVQDNPYRTDARPKRNEADKDQCANSSTRVKQQISAHQAEDSTAGPNTWNPRITLYQGK